MRHAVDVGHGPLQQVGRQAFAGPGAQELELLATADKIAPTFSQLVTRCCVGFIQLLQAVTHFIQILDKQHKLVVEPAGALRDFTGILTLALLLPEAVDHP